MSNVPRPRGPVTTTAILPSEGYADGRPTKHVFSHYLEVPIEDLQPGPGPQGMGPGRALIFRCTETDAERIFGME